MPRAARKKSAFGIYHVMFRKADRRVPITTLKTMSFLDTLSACESKIRFQAMSLRDKTIV